MEFQVLIYLKKNKINFRMLPATSLQFILLKDISEETVRREEYTLLQAKDKIHPDRQTDRQI